MKPFTRIVIFTLTMLLAPISPAQDKEQKSPEQKPARQVWIRLKSWIAEYDLAMILCVFDDRKKVVDMWRSLGLACFQVAPGDF